MHASLRAIRALTIALGLLLPAASTVAAAGPARPVVGHHPQFVTEREAGRWQDCLWASAAMLVDKWTAGHVQISKDALRRLSGDRTGGSNLDHLARALRQIGLPARTSPHGGVVITWASLKARLAAGGGAILLGDDSQLPRRYGRWDPKFWDNTGDRDDHAIYLDRYDRVHDRFWMMDPLAPADWSGEWISSRDLRAYAWSTPAGGLAGLMTPPAARPPFADVRLHGPIAFVGPNELHIGWPLARAPRHWAMPPTDVVVSVAPETGVLSSPHDIVLSAPPVGLTVAPTALGGQGPAPTVRLGNAMLDAIVPYPPAGGTYDVAVTLRERRFKQTVASAAVILYVPGDRRATIAAAPTSGPVPVGSFEFSADVTNSGSVSWADDPWTPGVPLAVSGPRNTRLVASWVLVKATDAVAPGVRAAPLDPVMPAPVALGALSFEPGQHATVTGNVATPITPGRWALILDIVDDADGSFAAHGSRPATILVDVVEATAGPPPRN